MRGLFLFLMLTLPATAGAQQARWWSPAVADSAMVVTAQPEATAVGVDILRRGGNAVDAAIAVHFALAVTHPQAGNIGGGGFMMVRTPEGAVHSYDYRERAPLAATEDMYLDAAGHPVEGASWYGWRAVGTPGSVAGMALVHQRHGTLPWAELIEPAIRYAEDGFEIRPYFQATLAGDERDIRRFPGAEAILYPGGAIPAVGDTLRQPALARTLRLIAQGGADAFYRGEIADSIAAAMAANGGLITREDLAAYEAKERPPVSFDYRGHRIHAMGPPSSGGLTMMWILEQLETFDLGEYPYHSAASVHRIVEAMRRAYGERNVLLGDPDHTDIPGAAWREGYGTALAATIDPLRATPSGEIRPELSAAAASEATETTHFSIYAPDGSAVASTTTINGLFGSYATVAGFFLNNEMDDLTIKPGVPNAYGLVQGRANAVAPGKRPLSAMTPTIVERDGQVRYLIGTPGGSTIITTVTQILIDLIDYGMTMAEAVDARRIHHQHLPDRIAVEPFGLSADTIEVLESMGHTVTFRGGYSGRSEGIEVGPEDGRLYGRSDLRGGGAADGF